MLLYNGNATKWFVLYHFYLQGGSIMNISTNSLLKLIDMIMGLVRKLLEAGIFA